MKKILALTVGGSSKPIVRSVLDHHPDKVLFFVTTFPDGGSKKKLLEKVNGEESIIISTGLIDSMYEIQEIKSPDNLTSCHKQIKQAMIRIVPEDRDCECIADYTSGTKTMAVSLAIAALDLDWKMSIVQGERTDLVKTLNGTEVVRLVSTSSLLLERTLKQAVDLFDLGQYEAVEEILRSFLSKIEISDEATARVQRLLTLSRGFAAWDRFEHERALPFLRAQGAVVAKYVRSLNELLAEKKGSGYEKVWDLLRNAERRARQGRFDDALLRLYRALEMFAQLRLRYQYEIDTSDVQLTKLPAQTQKLFSWQIAQNRKTITAGFYDSYRLLNDLGDPIGPIYIRWRDKIKDLLGRRNRSILAHGEDPIGQDIWQEAWVLTNGFLSEIAAAINVRTAWPQFPTWKEVMEQS